MSTFINPYSSNQTVFSSSSKGKRFANYIAFLFFSFFIGIFIGLVLIPFGLDFDLLLAEGSITGVLFDWTFGVLSLLVYYTATEYYLKGKTVAKFITKQGLLLMDVSS